MEIPRHWRLKAQRYRMQGSLCPGCNLFIFPPRRICPHCSTPLRTEISINITPSQHSDPKIFEADFHKTELVRTE